jgi:hypothetical protein
MRGLLETDIKHPSGTAWRSGMGMKQALPASRANRLLSKLRSTLTSTVEDSDNGRFGWRGCCAQTLYWFELN